MPDVGLGCVGWYIVTPMSVFGSFIQLATQPIAQRSYRLAIWASVVLITSAACSLSRTIDRRLIATPLSN